MDMNTKQSNYEQSGDPRIDSNHLKKCFRCGRNVNANWNFCPKCGTAISCFQKNEVQ